MARPKKEQQQAQTPAELKAQAAKLLEAAKELEEQQEQQAGRYLRKLHEKGFEGVTLEQIKEQAGKFFA